MWHSVLLWTIDYIELRHFRARDRAEGIKGFVASADRAGFNHRRHSVLSQVSICPASENSESVLPELSCGNGAAHYINGDKILNLDSM